MALTDTQKRVILRAYHRLGRYVCPTPGLWAASQAAVLIALRKSGLITAIDSCPTLTEAGVKVAESMLGPVMPPPFGYGTLALVDDSLTPAHGARGRSKDRAGELERRAAELEGRQ